MEQVTPSNIDDLLCRYDRARDGEMNEDTDSEAAFVFASKFGGAYTLHTGIGIFWVGLQNASARWSNGGEQFPSVRSAIESALNSTNPIQSIGGGVFYSEDSTERLRWLADRIESFKSCGSFLLGVK